MKATIADFPLRRVVSVRAQNPKRGDCWTVETLECGHDLGGNAMRPAKRRRCPYCKLQAVSA